MSEVAIMHTVWACFWSILVICITKYLIEELKAKVLLRKRISEQEDV